MHPYLKISPDEISTISFLPEKFDVSKLYQNNDQCVFKLITMGDKSDYEFPAIAIMDKDSDNIRTLIRLDQPVILELKELEDEAPEVSDFGFSSALPGGVL